MKTILATILMLVAFNAHAFKGLDTELTQRTKEAADLRVTITSDSKKIDNMMLKSYRVASARESIREVIASSFIKNQKEIAQDIAMSLYWKGIIVDTITLYSYHFGTQSFKIAVEPNINVTAVDLP